MRIPNLFALTLALLLPPLSAPAQARSTPDAGTPGAKADPRGLPSDFALEEDDLPRPARRTPEERSAVMRNLPSFLGIFGPQKLIENVGFRSAPGRYVEYSVSSSTAPGASVATVRYADVGSVGTRRWIEYNFILGAVDNVGFRILTNGTKDGNVERFIVASPDIVPMEVPLGSASVEAMPGVPENFRDIPLRKVGRVKVTVPLGTFDADHWVAGTDKVNLQYWVVQDPKVPFIGAVKMISSDGVMVATKVGNDAVAKIAVPPQRD